MTDESYEISDNAQLLRGEMAVLIYLHDRTALKVVLEDGQHSQAKDLMNIVFMEQNLPDEARSIFSLWLISPNLEVQLKPDHRPFEFAQNWRELCSKHSRYDDLDEPVLYFQRNVFYSPNLETQITDSNVLLYLYHEAKFNVIKGRYIMKTEDYYQLAGIQALIHFQLHNTDKDERPAYRSHLKQFFPDHLCHSKNFLPWTKSPLDVLETKLEQSHINLSKEYENRDMAAILPDLYRMYLEICWSYPFYGAAFFSGETESPRRFQALRGVSMTEVCLCINTCGLCAVDVSQSSLPCAVPYSRLSWEIKIPEKDDEMPELYLLIRSENEPQCSKLLIIYSRQIRLIDALIGTCFSKVQAKDGGQSGVGEKVTTKVCDFTTFETNLSRLSLSDVYSRSGQSKTVDTSE